MAKVSINVSLHEKRDLVKMLDNLTRKIKKQATEEAVDKAAEVVIKAAKRFVPVGDPRHKPENKPLKDTIMALSRKYYGGNMIVAFIGPGYPAGAHGHLVEGGHKVYRRGAKGDSARGKKLSPLSGAAQVPGTPFMYKAASTTKRQQDEAVIKTLQKYIKQGDK